MRADIVARRTTEPTVQPITVDELKAHLRITGFTDTYEDAFLALLILAAVGVCEEYCRIALLEQSWTGKVDAFCQELILPRPPLISITSVSYVDSDGNTQTASSTLYQVDSFSRPGKLLLAYNQSWPTTRGQPQAVTVVWKAGYGTTAATVPENLKHGLKLLCGAWYNTRESLDLAKPGEIPLPWVVQLLFDQYQSAQVW